MVSGILIAALYIYEIFLVARVLMPLLKIDSTNNIYIFVMKVTEPVLKPVREFILRLSNGSMMFDFSPIIVYLVIELILVRILRYLPF